MSRRIAIARSAFSCRRPQAFAGERILGIFAKPDKTFRDDADDATMYALALYSGMAERLTDARCKRVSKRLLRLQEQTRHLVERHRSEIERVARALQAKKRFSGDEISTLLAEAA